MKSAALLTLCAALPAFASVSEARTIGGFDALEVANAIEAKITQGDTVKVRVEANDADTLKHVVTELKDGTLKVRLEDKFCFRCEVKVEITTPKLARLHVSGASKAQVDGTFGPRFDLESSGAAKTVVRGLKAAALSVDASGASNVELVGQVTAVALELSGASTCDAPKLSVQSAKVELSGASNAELRAEKGIDADLSGASSLTVRGNPSNRHVDTSGGSNVRFKD
jgi:hypothetical protein